MRTSFLGFLLAAFLTPSVLRAQTLPLPPATARHEANAPVSLSLQVPAAALATYQRSQPRRSWRARHPVLFGALVGAGAGVAVELTVIPGARGGEPHTAYLPMFSAVGAGVGALTGLIVSDRGPRQTGQRSFNRRLGA